MRVIDENGKLFGKINVIDFLVILVLLCFLPTAILAYKIISERNKMTQIDFMELELDCKFIKLSPRVAESISPGDKELNANNKVIGEILSVEDIASYKYQFDLGGGLELEKDDPYYKSRICKVKIAAENRDGNLYYKSVAIKKGSKLRFNSEEYNEEFILLEEEEEKKEEKELELFVILKNLDKEVSKLVTIGDKELGVNGEIVAEILSLGRPEDNILEFQLAKGGIISTKEKNKKQISAKMKLLCGIKNDSQPYYKDKELTFREPFVFTTDNYSTECYLSNVYNAYQIGVWKRLKVRFVGMAPEISKIVNKGDVEKAINDEVLARISSIESNNPSQVLMIKEGLFVELSHPFNRDVVFNMEFKCVEKEGGYYYKNYPVKIGNNISFSTELYSIMGEIIGLEAYDFKDDVQ